MNIQQEDRVLRAWTPVLLRTILICSVALLLVGLSAMAIESPGYYSRHFHEIQHRRIWYKDPSPALLPQALHGQPHALMIAGLMALTLVPLVRVAFCLFFFIREKDLKFVIFTAYVLGGLLVGVLLGKIG